MKKSKNKIIHTLNDDLDYILQNGSCQYTFDRAERRFNKIAELLKSISMNDYKCLRGNLNVMSPNYPDKYCFDSYIYEDFVNTIKNIKNRLGDIVYGST